VIDVFDRYWQWVDKPLNSLLTIPVEVHEPIMRLEPDDRRNRGKVTEAVARWQSHE